MSADENRAIVRQWYEILNAQALDRFDQVFAPGFVDHNPLVPGGNLEGARQLFAGYFAAFPDLQVTVEDLVAEGDRVAVRFTARGTHHGPGFGVPPSGTAIAIAGIDILRIADGRIAEHWGEADLLGLMQQLGAISTPGQ